MLRFLLVMALTALISSTASAGNAPPIQIVDSATPSVEIPVKPGVYIGQKITFTDEHPENVTVRIGVWEAGESKMKLTDYPFTEYVLMISGHLVITNDDGTVMEFRAGDTFVMPKGWTGIWEVREHMKKQMVQIGDPEARPKSEPVK